MHIKRVKATPKEVRIDRATNQFYFTGVWTNSYEADQHLSYNETADMPVCWSFMGYASGWSSAFWGGPLLAIEPVCVGKGDSHCEWLIKPLGEWGPEATPYIAALQDQFKSDFNVSL